MTIVDNFAAASVAAGAGLAESDSEVGLANTIVGANTHAAMFPMTSAVPWSAIRTRIGTGGSGSLVNGVDGNQVGVANPGLGTLAFNGPIQTIAVLPGSPAIGAGSRTIPMITVPTVDQRGVARPPDSIDVGAYQPKASFTPRLRGAAPRYTPINKAFTVPLSVLVTSPYGDPVAGEVFTFEAPGSGASAVSSAEEANDSAPTVWPRWGPLPTASAARTRCRRLWRATRRPRSISR